MTREDAEKIAAHFMLIDTLGSGLHWHKKPRVQEKLVQLILRISDAELNAVQQTLDERRGYPAAQKVA